MHAIIEWAHHYLVTHGYHVQSALPEIVQDTPWSYVARFNSNQGNIYLKYTPKLLALEPQITKILHHQFQAPVPLVIAHNTELQCFLMKDAGKPLRAELKKQFDAHLLCQAVDQLTRLQMTIADQLSPFLEIGVPDWRLDQLPKLYQELLLQQDILIADGLTAEEIQALEDLLPKISNLCKKLASYSIKQTIIQPDFHDNNIMIDDSLQHLTFIDLGEMTISHPFFLLVNYFHQIKKHHGLTEQDSNYLMIKETSLNHYTRFEPKERVLEAFEIAHVLFFVYGALCNYRLLMACGKEKFTASFQLHGRVSIPLKELLTRLK